MSLRYTGEATMDEPALRDVERWKDKIEVRLDNRQVFFLFFGSAMVACMLFVLGVIVGKRLESRGRAEAPTVEDPLAALDRFGAPVAAGPAPAALTFPKALLGGGGGTPAKVRTASVDRPEKLERSERVAERVVEAPAVERLPVAARPAAAKPILTAATPLPAPALAPAPAPVSKKLAALPRPLTASAQASPLSKIATPAAPATKEPSQPAKVVTKTPPASAAGKGRFLLQLSSFQDRGEADAFARRFAGQNAYVVATEIPGKGTWYRVRVGSYGSMQEAAAAKANFERDHNVIAYVAGSGPAR